MPVAGGRLSNRAGRAGGNRRAPLRRVPALLRRLRRHRHEVGPVEGLHGSSLVSRDPSVAPPPFTALTPRACVGQSAIPATRGRADQLPRDRSIDPTRFPPTNGDRTVPGATLRAPWPP